MRMMEKSYKTYLEVNEDNIRYNINYLKEVSHKKLIAVVKANGYGTSDFELARIASKEGVDLLAVSSIYEAVNLRKKGILTDILILGAVDIEHFDIVREYGFHIVTVSKDYVLNNARKFLGIKVHLKLNTGMNRIGILPSEAKEVFDVLRKSNAAVVGIMTHYACSDCDDVFTQKQYKEFNEVVESLNYQFKYIHTCNTDATVSLNDEVSNYVRCGLGLLGYSLKKSELKPAVSLYSEVINVKKVPTGEGVGYGQKYISNGKGYILTVPIGYADGYLRSNSGRLVYVGDELCVVTGNVCMDQMMVKSEVERKIGDRVELFGEHISIVQRAKDTKTVVNELLTNISSRVTRVFVCYRLKDKVINERYD